MKGESAGGRKGRRQDRKNNQEKEIEKWREEDEEVES